MTWSKYGIEFWEEMAADELSDAAARTHGEVIGWLYQVERGSCMVPKSKVYKVTNSPENHAAVRELVRLGYWKEHDSAFEIVHHGGVIRQSLTAQDAKRGRDAKAQARVRGRRGAASVTDSVTKSADDSASAQTDSQTTSRYDGTHVPAQRDEQEPDWPEVARPGVVGSWDETARGYER